jgi:hypothetical protein
LSRVSAPGPSPPLRWPLVYLGVALTTLATLLLELSLTRIYSVVFRYHFAFLAVSVALFGLGAGGVLSYAIARRGRNVFRNLGIASMANSIVVVAALGFLLSREGDLSNLTLAAVYLSSASPFVLAGAIVSLAISETMERVDRVYFFDLAGAACGCLMLVPLLQAFGGPNAMIAGAVLFSSAAAIWFTLAASARNRIIAVAAGLALVVLMIYNQRQRLIDVRYAKGSRIGEEQFVKWNGISRIGVVTDTGGMKLIVIDADASTGIADKDLGNLTTEQRSRILAEGPGLPYALRPASKALVIGPGGGWDVMRALLSGSNDVTGVEINRIIADTIMRDTDPSTRRADWSRRIYLRPEVRIFVEDGRSFVRRSPEKYRILQATLVDTWASTAAGAFALTENNLYTTEAFHDYLSHLTPDGLMSFTRWGFDPPRESLRLLSLAIEALSLLGENDPASHVMVVRENVALIGAWGATDTVLVSRKPFSGADVERMREIIAGARMQAVYLPGHTEGPFAQLLTTGDRARFYRDYRFDVTPVGDDRPFFFYTVQPRDLWAFLNHASRDSADFKVNQAVPLLFGLVGISILAIVIMLVLPPLLLGARLPAEKGIRTFLLFFVCVGTGYILIQVALIQKFVLFLGHPTYALTVIAFSMLVASGLGSFFSRRFGMADPARLRRVLVLIPILVTLLAFTAGPVTSAGIGWPLPVRLIVASAMIAPAAFFMGMPFPSALARLEQWHRPSVRWAWSLNAAASVMGSALAIFLALYLGLRDTLITGGVFYLGAFAASRVRS